MILLVTTGHPDMARYAHPNLGRLVQPRHYSSIEATAHAGIPWAADNDAFGNFEPEPFAKMCERLRGLPGCLFVTAPDVLGDARRTLELFDEWQPRLSPLPLALVAQNGLHPRDVPWDRIDALFVGGDDTFKLGPAGERVSKVALDRGKWLHVGRVNTLKRIRYCATLGADSVDGSQWARWKSIWLNHGLAAVSAPRQPQLSEDTG